MAAKPLPVYRVAKRLAAVKGSSKVVREPGFRITTAASVKGDRLTTKAGYVYPLGSLQVESKWLAAQGPKFTKVARVQPPAKGNFQGCIPVKDGWIVAEARKQSDGSEDAYFWKAPLGAPGATVKTGSKPFILNATPGNGLHPTGWGASDDGVLWLTWNGEGTGNAIVTANYVAGRTQGKAACQKMNIFDTRNCQIAFDTANTMATVRHVGKTVDTHTLRSKQDILDGKDQKLGTVAIPRSDDRVVQGFTLVKVGTVWELRVLVGLKSANSPFRIERWNATTGKHIATVALPDTLGREPEGIDGDLVGFKTEDRSAVDVYRYTV